MTAPARFRQADLTRAVRGVEDAGIKVGRVEIDANGKIVILPSDQLPARQGSSWDQALSRLRDQ